GVPVVTLVGPTLAGRQTLSILSSAGVTETVTPTIDEYVALAVRLADDRATLARLRQTLRPALASSAFCDPARFVPALAEAFRGMWREWCESQSSGRC
ncbi:MAG: hypothetical protein JNM18_01290, partial [Planctomycetaceae bacterium]|nr:hypothetical protein [Planctomycetaceae bacterium]